jgi:glycosyltransferase involved in cell wall biosynthesis
MELTVIIPTRNRLATVSETLDRLERQAAEMAFETIVVDDGSEDGTVEALKRRAAGSAFAMTLLEQHGRGPATARNRALAAARAPVCLFIDDDTWPRPGLLRRHRDFHARHPEQEAALLGFVDIAPEPPPTPFMVWLASLHLAFDEIDDPANLGGHHFYTGNVSAKTELVRRVGGFDESYPSACYEDTDLGMRLQEQGLRLFYEVGAAVEHSHPTDLLRSIARMRAVGRSHAKFAQRHPNRPIARRPDLRHWVKAAGLTAFALLHVRPPRIQRETWRFLCHQAEREGYWDAVDERDGRRPARTDELRIGRTLARLASRDADAQMPPPGGPGNAAPSRAATTAAA